MTDPSATGQWLNQWREMTRSDIGACEQTFAQLQASPEWKQASDEGSATLLGMRSALADLNERVVGPLIEMSGGVSQADHRRLADEVHTVLLRLDRIDDQLGEIRRALTALAARPAGREPGANRARSATPPAGRAGRR